MDDLRLMTCKDESDKTIRFCIDIVIDLHPPDSIDLESGDDITRCATAAAGSVLSWLGDTVVSSHGFPYGEKECKAVNRSMENFDLTGLGVYKFNVPPHRPTAAEMSPDATLLPQQSDSDIRILLVVTVSTGLPLDASGDELFRMACELKEIVTESSKNLPRMKVHRVDVEPATNRADGTMQRFLDSHVEPNRQ